MAEGHGSANRKRVGSLDNSVATTTISFVNWNENWRKQVGNTDKGVWNGISQVVGAAVRYTAWHQRLALKRTLG